VIASLVEEHHNKPDMDAILVIDKPAGITSHDVVARVRRLLGERSVGHLGTLDPSATGVLPLVTGRFTRLAQFFHAASKTYQGVIRFGFATDSYDADGEPVAPAQTVQVSLEEVRRGALDFVGKLNQLPPRFSAKKIAGVPAYKLARKKQEIDLKPVPVTVHRFEIQQIEADRASFITEVSAGTYVRSLAHELGQKLGVGAHLAELRRTVSGEFTMFQATTLERLAEMKERSFVRDQQLEELIAEISLHPRRILPQLPAVTVNEETLRLIANGRAVNLAEFSAANQVKVFFGQDELIAVASRIAGTLFQPKVVLRTAADRVAISDVR
jgi:tRNA pseudouridine55 synthase